MLCLVKCKSIGTGFIPWLSVNLPVVGWHLFCYTGTEIDVEYAAEIKRSCFSFSFLILDSVRKGTKIGIKNLKFRHMLVSS